MFKLFIQGYGGSEELEKSQFVFEKHHPGNYLLLFVGYSDYNVEVGQKIKSIYKKGKLLNVELEIKKVFLGFGAASDLLPKGYKSVILVKGPRSQIALIKRTLSKVKAWNESDEDFVATDAIKVRQAISESKKRWVKATFPNGKTVMVKCYTRGKSSHNIVKERCYLIPSKEERDFDLEIKKLLSTE